MQISKININNEAISALAFGMLFCDWHIHYLFNTLSSLVGIGIINIGYYAIKYLIMAAFLYSTHMRVKRKAFYWILGFCSLIGATAIFFPKIQNS